MHNVLKQVCTFTCKKMRKREAENKWLTIIRTPTMFKYSSTNGRNMEKRRKCNETEQLQWNYAKIQRNEPHLTVWIKNVMSEFKGYKWTSNRSKWFEHNAFLGTIQCRSIFLPVFYYFRKQQTKGPIMLRYETKTAVFKNSFSNWRWRRLKKIWSTTWKFIHWEFSPKDMKFWQASTCQMRLNYDRGDLEWTLLWNLSASVKKRCSMKGHEVASYGVALPIH